MFTSFILMLNVVCFVTTELSKMIPERIFVEYANEKYLVETKANIRRYARNGEYYINTEGRIKHSWGDNITVDYVVYEYLHNEYKRSFLEFHITNLCHDFYYSKSPVIQLAREVLTKDDIVTTCPVPAGLYKFLNVTMPKSLYQIFSMYALPFEKGKVVMEVKQKETKELMLRGSLYFHAIVTYRKASSSLHLQ